MDYKEYQQIKAQQAKEEEEKRTVILKPLIGKTIKSITTEDFNGPSLWINIHTTCGQHYTFHLAGYGSAHGYGVLDVTFDEQELYEGEG